LSKEEGNVVNSKKKAFLIPVRDLTKLTKKPVQRTFLRPSPSQPDYVEGGIPRGPQEGDSPS
jgi:hypothetical protein